MGKVISLRPFAKSYSRRQQSEEVRVTTEVPHGSVLGPLLFLAYVKDICLKVESNKRLFADDCITYRKMTGSSDIDKLQTDLNRFGEWAVENEMKINPDKLRQ